MVGVAVNIVLAAVKLYIGLKTNSITVMLDATNSTLDIVTALITVIAFAALLAPRGEKAPYGYGRCEYLASFVVATVSCVVGVLFFVRSLNRLAMPEPIWFGASSAAIIAVAVALKLGLGLFYLFINKKLKSKAIAAITLDSFLDTGITAVSLISYSVSGNVYYSADAIFGIVISVVVIIFGIKIVVDSVKTIVLGDGCADEKEAICKYFEDKPSVTAIMAIVLHDYGYYAKVGSVKLKLAEGTSEDDAKSLADEAKIELGNMTGAELDVQWQIENGAD